MMDKNFPGAGNYDAKSTAFFTLTDVTVLRFQTLRNTVEVTFAKEATPQNLMTTNDVPFMEYPDYNKWRAAFAQDRAQAPIFMRAGVAVTMGSLCRQNPQNTPSGCGQRCVFCYQAADGSCCPCNVTANDVNSGVGNNAAYCGAGLNNCSAGGSWSDSQGQALVWAR
jgi:hypothetical protein